MEDGPIDACRAMGTAAGFYDVQYWLNCVATTSS